MTTDVTIEDICAMAIWFGAAPARMAAEWRELGERDRAEIFGLFSAAVYGQEG